MKDRARERFDFSPKNTLVQIQKKMMKRSAEKVKRYKLCCKYVKQKTHTTRSSFVYFVNYFMVKFVFKSLQCVNFCLLQRLGLNLFLNSVGHVWFVRHLQDTARICPKKKVLPSKQAKACCALCSSRGHRRGTFFRERKAAKFLLFEKGHYLDK